jgi:hypothetical protein
MSFGTRTKWLTAIFVVIFIALFVWKFNAPRAPKSVAVPASAKSIQAPSDQNLGAASRIPILVPGDTCERASDLYGRPTEKDEFGGTWEKQDFKAFIGANSKCVITGIDVEVKPGHHTTTPDGIVLGLNTVADAERILRSRISVGSESVEGPEGIWEAKITFAPEPGSSYKASYIAILKPETASQMNRDPVFADFRSVTVSGYGLDTIGPLGQAKAKWLAVGPAALLRL